MSNTQVLIDYEEKMSRTEAAAFLETVAKKLKEDGSFTMNHNDRSLSISPSPNVTLEVKVEKKNKKHKLELEIEWTEGEQASSLSIE